jgi:hypothetical protein
MDATGFQMNVPCLHGLHELSRSQGAGNMTVGHDSELQGHGMASCKMGAAEQKSWLDQ